MSLPPRRINLSVLSAGTLSKARAADLIRLSGSQGEGVAGKEKRQPRRAADARTRARPRVNSSTNLLNVIAAPVPQSESTLNLARFYRTAGARYADKAVFPRRRLRIPAYSVSDREQTASGPRAIFFCFSFSFFSFFHDLPPFCFRKQPRRAIYALKRRDAERKNKMPLMRLMNVHTGNAPSMDDSIALLSLSLSLFSRTRRAFNERVRQTGKCRFLLHVVAVVDSLASQSKRCRDTMQDAGEDAGVSLDSEKEEIGERN